MADPFIGEICIFAFDYAPDGWALCNGQALSVSQNNALYALIGNRYGGNTSTFNLPNLMGRVPVGMGAGAGLTPRTLAQSGGQESTVLTAAQLAAHAHGVNITTTVNVSTGNANTPTPVAGAYLAKGLLADGRTNTSNYATGTPTSPVALGGVSSQAVGNATGTTGSSQPVPVMNPFLALNFCIALIGIFPARP